MNNDLISRSELKKAFKNHPLCNDVWLHYSREIIDNAPTVEGYKNVIVGGMNNPYNAGYMDGIRQAYKELERPQGEWKVIRVADHRGVHDSFVCPFCNYEREYRKKNFCEECGADLRGTENGKEELH